MHSPESKDLVLQLRHLIEEFNPTSVSRYGKISEKEEPNNLEFGFQNAEKKFEFFFQHTMIGPTKKLLLLIKIKPKTIGNKVGEMKFLYDEGQQKWISKEGEYFDNYEMGKLIYRKF